MYEQISARKFLMGKIKEKIIDLGFIKTKKTFLNNKTIILTDIGSNAVLKQVSVYGWGGFEPELSKFMKNYNFDIDLFIDGGANIGYYSVLFSVMHRESKVVAIEALDRNIKYMKKLRDVNSLNFEILNKAIDISDNNKIELFIPINIGKNKLSTIGSVNKDFRSSSNLYAHVDYEVKKVKTITVETILKDFEKTLIKLDIEGNELKVLKSSLNKLQDKEVDFVLEIMINDQDKKELFDLMVSFGYKGYLITNAGLVAEEKALTLPYPYKSDRTLWKNHFFTKKDVSEVEKFSRDVFGYFI